MSYLAGLPAGRLRLQPRRQLERIWKSLGTAPVALVGDRGLLTTVLLRWRPLANGEDADFFLRIRVNGDDVPVCVNTRV